MKIIVSWSGGKDAALMLFKLLAMKRYETVALVTTFNAKDKSSSAHQIPLPIIQQQAELIGIPLQAIFLDKKPNDYIRKMNAFLKKCKNRGVEGIAFGDLYVEETKSYREKLAKSNDLKLILPLFGETQETILKEYFESGIAAKIVTTQADTLGEKWIDKKITPELIEEFPEKMDVCGEQGEYHTIVYDAPYFSQPLEVEIQSAKLLKFEIGLTSGKKVTYAYWQAVFK